MGRKRMPKSMPKWKRKLTAVERDHIKETTNCGTLVDFQANREWQLKKGIRCVECESIARKLALMKS